jgi:hypothetical protein
MTEEGGTGGDAGTGGEGEPQTPVWTEGLSEDIRGYVENKGWDGMEAAISSYQHLEKQLGAPPDSLVRVPTDFDDQEATNEFYGKLGRPESAEQYEFPEFDVEEGETDLTPHFREIAFKRGLSQRAARGCVEDFADVMDKVRDERITQINLDNEAGVQRLKAKWGQAFDANIQAGKNFEARFGIDEEMDRQLNGVLGSERFLEMAAAIGRALGESAGPPVDGSGADGFLAITPGAAKAKIADLQMDPDFLKAYQDKTHINHEAAVQKMFQLQQAANPEP